MSSGSLLNVAGIIGQWDPYPFILLNLVFSTQAAYAAPLILLAQNRQADRDKEVVERDRETNARSLAETEFLAREIAAVRIALEQKADRDDLRRAARAADARDRAAARRQPDRGRRSTTVEAADDAEPADSPLRTAYSAESSHQ